MAKKRKLLRKVLSGSKNVRFEDFQALLLAFGFVLDRISGSHHIYIHHNVPQAVSVQPDNNGKAKLYQLKQFAKLIEKYDLRLNDDENESDEANGAE